MLYILNQFNADSEESFLGLGLFPSNKKIWFNLRNKGEVKKSEHYNKERLFFSAGFSLDSDVTFYKRSIYTTLDLLGDIGGLFDALKGISSFIVAFYFNIFGDPIQSYLLTALFLRNPKEESNRRTERLSSAKQKLEYLRRRKSFTLPRVFCTCFRNKKDSKMIN